MYVHLGTYNHWQIKSIPSVKFGNSVAPNSTALIKMNYDYITIQLIFADNNKRT